MIKKIIQSIVFGIGLLIGFAVLTAALFGSIVFKFLLTNGGITLLVLIVFIVVMYEVIND